MSGTPADSWTIGAAESWVIASLWSPQTDAGVLAQVIATLIIFIGGALAVRRERSLVLLVVGVGTVILAWYGFRAIH